MLVIGLGRFGGHLARKLMELGNEVMAVDVDEAVVAAIAKDVTWAQVGDCMDPDTLARFKDSVIDSIRNSGARDLAEHTLTVYNKILKQ